MGGVISGAVALLPVVAGAIAVIRRTARSELEQLAGTVEAAVLPTQPPAPVSTLAAAAGRARPSSISPRPGPEVDDQQSAP